jgi:DNA repair exonuclease SbcCD ATPase subunit
MRLLASKTSIDESLLKIDINTLNTSLNSLKENGSFKKNELEFIQDELKELTNIEFSIDEYDNLVTKTNELNLNIQLQRQEYITNNKLIEELTKGEYCPTCGKKYDNIDNSQKIAELQNKQKEIMSLGKIMNSQKTEIDAKIIELKDKREKYEKRSKLEVKKSVLELQLAQLRNEYKEKSSLFNEYKKNNEAIDKNNNIDIEIRNIEYKIKNFHNTRDTNITYIENRKNTITTYIQNIKERNEIINQINNEAKIIRHWKIYLDMIGKNGISKMVLRKTLPIINAQITRMLTDVCDFNVEVAINEKNEVNFYIIKDGVKSDLSSGSGFEKTASALALRVVLANMSTLPRINILILDEVLGRVAKENFENMRTLYEKILENYDAIIQISHLSEIKDWHDKHIVVSKENNVSKIHIKQ